MANNSKKKSNGSKKNTANKTTNVEKKNKIVKEEIKKEEPAKKEKVVLEKKETKETKSSKKFSLTSKQKDIVLVLLVVVLLVVAGVVTGIKKDTLDIELPVALEGEAGYTEITYAEYEEKIASQKPFMVVIVKDGCHYCEEYEPILEEVAPEYNVPIYYINLAHLTSEDSALLSKSNSYLRKQKWGTPTTLLLYGDKVIDSIGGYVEKDTLVSFLEKNVEVK